MLDTGSAARGGTTLGVRGTLQRMSGSTFGQLFRVTTAGESHGPGNVAIIDGVPPGLALSEADLQPDLDRRRPGQSKIVTQRQEADSVEMFIVSRDQPGANKKGKKLERVESGDGGTAKIAGSLHARNESGKAKGA